MGKKIDITGKRFGHLVALNPTEQRRHYNVIWQCKCDCGNICKVSTDALKTGNTQSCGCKKSKFELKHGYAGKRIYRIYQFMKQRCYNPKNTHWGNYGGRGITVCDEWKNDFQKFCNWAMTTGYRDDLTIDRIDNNGNYSANNCRWISQKEQCNNRNTNVLIEIDGVTRNLKQWSNITGIPDATLSGRYKKGKRGNDLLSPIK